jgi:cytoskeleton protein RodZ
VASTGGGAPAATPAERPETAATIGTERLLVQLSAARYGRRVDQATRIASVLRRAREERGLSLEDAAADAGIPLRYARLLEGEAGGASVGISDELYLIPFFRRYARFLGMNPEDMVSDLVGEVESVVPSAPPTRLSYRSPLRGLWKPFGLGVLASIAVALILRQGPERPVFDDERWSDRDAPRVEASPAAASLAALAPERRGEVVGADGTAATPSPRASSDSATLGAASGAVAAGAAPAPAVAPSAVVPARELRITAAEETWLSLGIDEEPKKNILLQPGETRTWTANGTFVLTLGNAGGVTVVLDGRELPPLGRSGQVVRNLRLPEGAPRPPSEG